MTDTSSKETPPGPDVDTENTTVDDVSSDVEELADASAISSLFVKPPDADDMIVKLIRVGPTISLPDPATGQSYKITGFLEELTALEHEEEYIKLKYGGGDYKIIQHIKRNGRWLFGHQVAVSIPGPPKLPDFSRDPVRPLSEAAGEASPLVNLSGDVPKINVNGTDIPLTPSTEKFLEMVMMVKAADAMFPQRQEPTDINAVLLQHILDRSNTGSSVGRVQEIADLISTIKTLLPDSDGGGGNDVLSVINNALIALQKLADKSKPAPAPGRVVVPGKPVAQLPANTETETNSQIEAEEAVELNTQQIAQTAIANIISGFRLDPPMEVDDLVQALDDVLPLSKEVRSQLPAFKKKLWNLTRLSLSDHFAEIPDSQDQFETYFNEVFDRFVDLEREIVTLGR